MRVLLTGATGFVGRHVYPALVAAGCEVRCASRNPDRARSLLPDRDWVAIDVESEDSARAALDGCDAALYLVHDVGHGADYPEHEACGARAFSAAASAAGVERIVYLGGALPEGESCSKHLASRRTTGEILRAGAVPTIELRAAMIVGSGSASWTMVRDLSERLPAMLLPRWLRNYSYPVAIDDVVWALVASLSLPPGESRVLELPGPQRMSHREVLEQTAELMGFHRYMISVPVLSPRLSSYWIALVTRIELSMARELVNGVSYNLSPREDVFWDQLQRSHQPLDFEQAARLALADETADAVPAPGAAQRARTAGSEFTGAIA